MSLITQCPACSTMFRVVPDQLRISEGWVRCGQCDEVFDANAHLRSLEAPASVTSAEGTRIAPNNPGSQATPAGVEQSSADAVYDWGPMLGPQAEKVTQTSSDDAQETSQNATKPDKDPSWDLPPRVDPSPPPEDSELVDVLLDPPTDLPVTAESHDAQFAASLSEDWAHQPLVVEEKDLAPRPKSEDEAAPSFMPRDSQNSSVRHAVLGRRVALSLSVVLALLLTSQFLYFERDRIAANAPASRPLFYSVCEFLGCVISAPRQIEAIAIESSAFTHVKSGIYNLSLNLRNAAAIDLAAPAIELTLTDMQDQALVRRVLMPDDYSAKTLIGSHAELAVSVPIAVRADSASEKISGYKLLAFYP